ncbi:diacylglycerol/lipid kinase family protein [Dermabacter vaginalis]|uniref:diacylglycerol/lipid kinase family protein n=1 Tax=Dermabacter vaginalis TaxID=1630135 RepID=UPI001EF43033|nr:diacylglycerol kinase family protein [Dermabacter vaginalis]MCG7442635.1 sphingosine kinase [Dermabacter vaginalis]
MNRLRVGVIANPYAAKRRAGNIGHDVCALLSVAGLSVVDLSAPDARTARRRARAVLDTLDALVVVGGDGTVALGASLVCGTRTRLGIVPAGSGNDLARALGLPLGDPDAAVRTIVSALARPEQRIDAIETHFEGEGETESVIALGNLNMGFDAIVNARANRSRYGYTAAVARELLAYRPREYWVEIDGGARTEFEASLLTLCNSGYFGGGMKYCPSSRLDDGILELVSVAGIPRAGLVRFFPRVFSGTHASLEQYTLTRCTSLRIGSREPLEVCSDGESRSFLPLHARVLPGAVSILSPPLHDDETEEGTA